MKISGFICLVFGILTPPVFSQHTLKVHFLYGSVPGKQHQDEPRWFGGKLGGHVGVELEGEEKVFNFVPSGSFHVFQDKKDKHSRFTYHSHDLFYSILGGDADSNKKTIVYIPITDAQKQYFDSLSFAYTRQTPYDYAFFGMRCGSAAYDILAQLGIVKSLSYYNTHTQIFYPKKLRKKILKLAEQNHWKVERFDGSAKRNWEKD